MIQFNLRISKIDVNDEEFIGGIYAEDWDDYITDGILRIWELESVPVELPATMRAMKSTKKEVNNRLADWTEYLNAMYDANRNNEWGAQILFIDQPTLDSPEYVFKLRCPPRIYSQISNRRNKGAIFMASLTITRMTTLNGKGKRIRKIKMQLKEMNKMQVIHQSSR